MAVTPRIAKIADQSARRRWFISTEVQQDEKRKSCSIFLFVIL